MLDQRLFGANVEGEGFKAHVEGLRHEDMENGEKNIEEWMLRGHLSHKLSTTYRLRPT